MTATATLTSDEQKVSSLIDELLAEFPPRSTDGTTFLGAQFDKGLAWVHFEVGHGGLDGLSVHAARKVVEAHDLGAHALQHLPPELRDEQERQARAHGVGDDGDPAAKRRITRWKENRPADFWFVYDV